MKDEIAGTANGAKAIISSDLLVVILLCRFVLVKVSEVDTCASAEFFVELSAAFGWALLKSKSFCTVLWMVYDHTSHIYLSESLAILTMSS